MGLFTSSNRPEQKNRPTPSDAISSVIAKEMRITGEIAFKGKTRIDGILEGDIKGEYLILSENGRIHGNLTLDTLVCHGSVKGDIEANTITVHKTASIQGKLVSGNLTVEPGASIDGEIHALTDTKQSTAPALKPRQPAVEKKAAPGQTDENLADKKK
jgi:cytoskeletal protein CcmA (bactofilin family)